jgi:hypothetical protein
VARERSAHALVEVRSFQEIESETLRSIHFKDGDGEGDGIFIDQLDRYAMMSLRRLLHALGACGNFLFVAFTYSSDLYPRYFILTFPLFYYKGGLVLPIRKHSLVAKLELHVVEKNTMSLLSGALHQESA